MTRKPQIHARLLIHRTRPFARGKKNPAKISLKTFLEYHARFLFNGKFRLLKCRVMGYVSLLGSFSSAE